MSLFRAALYQLKQIICENGLITMVMAKDRMLVFNQSSHWLFEISAFVPIAFIGFGSKNPSKDLIPA